MTDAYSQADLYCAAFSFPIDDDVDWALEECERQLGRRPTSVLEPMCGNARFGKAFVERGLDYLGLDISKDMLKRAEAHEGVMTTCADARSFEFPGRSFDIGWCPINSIRHINTPEGLVQHLQCMAKHLPEGDLYLVETDLNRLDGPLDRNNAIEWSMPQSDGTTVKALWGSERAELAKRQVWEFARFERLRGEECLESVDCDYVMLMTTADDWHEWAAATGFTIDHVAKRIEGRRELVPLTPEIEDYDDSVTLFLRRTNTK
ncbi:MAG: class I SAM-dependent methyltransferase [Planctomycetota bacterium]|nr:class I SAM-dependent methyltransferase [Planctomycetota bacterium]